eukprot:Nk52_evm15s267 gene=Nk52_evmTU15s267
MATSCRLCFLNFVPTLMFFITFMITCQWYCLSASGMELHVGSIMPLDMVEGYDGMVLIRAGLKDFGSVLYGGHTLKYDPNVTFFLDDRRKPLLGLKHASDLIQIQQTIVVIGAFNSAVTVQVATYAASTGIVVISGGSTSPALSEKKSYPSFVRNIASDSFTYVVQADLLREFKWKKVGILTTDDAFAFEGTQVFRSRCEELGIVVTTVELLPFNYVELKKEHLVAEKFANLINSGATILLVNAVPNDARPIFEYAATMGVLGDPRYMFLGGGSWPMGELFDQNWDREKAPLQLMHGCMGLAPRVDASSEQFKQLLQSWNRDKGEFGVVKENPGFWAYAYYDSSRMVIMALNQTFKRLETLGILPDCLEEAKITLSRCQLPETERDAIRADSVKADYKGVVEFQNILSPDEFSFGPFSRSPQVLFLQEFYKIDAEGSLNHLKLLSTGDGMMKLDVVNLQPVASQKNGRTVVTYEWLPIGHVIPDITNSGQNFTITMTEPAHFMGGTIENPNLTPPSDSDIKLDPCDMIDIKDFNMWAQLNLAWDNYSTGQAVELGIGMFCFILVTAAVTYIAIFNSKLRGTSLSSHNVPWVMKSKSNFFFVISIILEYFFLVTIPLAADYSWVKDEDVQTAVKWLTFSESAFVFIYITLILIVLYVVYGTIHLLKFSHAIADTQIGAIFLEPSFMYLHVMGTFGIVPAAGMILKLFNCSYLKPLDDAHLFFFCDEKCFSSQHYGLLIMGGVFLGIYLFMAIITSHFWQVLKNFNVPRDEAIYFSRGYILFTQIIYVIIVAVRDFLSFYPEAYASIIIFACLGRLLYHYFHCSKRVVNVKWLDILLYLQDAGSIVVSAMALIFHIADIESYWPLLVILATILLMLLGTFIYLKRNFSPLFLDDQGVTENIVQKQMDLLVDDITKIAKRKNSELVERRLSIAPRHSSSSTSSVTKRSNMESEGQYEQFLYAFQKSTEKAKSEIKSYINIHNVSAEDEKFINAVSKSAMFLLAEYASTVAIELEQGSAGEPDFGKKFPVGVANEDKGDIARRDALFFFMDFLILAAHGRGMRVASSGLQSNDLRRRVLRTGKEQNIKPTLPHALSRSRLPAIDTSINQNKVSPLPTSMEKLESLSPTVASDAQSIIMSPSESCATTSINSPTSSFKEDTHNSSNDNSKGKTSIDGSHSLDVRSLEEGLSRALAKSSQSLLSNSLKMRVSRNSYDSFISHSSIAETNSGTDILDVKKADAGSETAEKKLDMP